VGLSSSEGIRDSRGLGVLFQWEEEVVVHDDHREVQGVGTGTAALGGHIQVVQEEVGMVHIQVVVVGVDRDVHIEAFHVEVVREEAGIFLRDLGYRVDQVVQEEVGMILHAQEGVEEEAASAFHIRIQVEVGEAFHIRIQVEVVEEAFHIRIQVEEEEEEASHIHIQEEEEVHEGIDLHVDHLFLLVLDDLLYLFHVQGKGET
jgi:hypothetical protein